MKMHGKHNHRELPHSHFQGELANSELERNRSIVNILKGFEEYTLDSAGTIISSNLEAVNITGYDEWDVIGRPFSIFYTNEDQILGKPFFDLRKANELGTSYVSGLRVKKKNTTFWAKTKFEAIRNETGDIVFYKLIIHDSTHKAISNLKLKKMRDEYLNLFNNSFIGIYKFSMADYRIMLMNDKASEILGPSAKERKFNMIFRKPSQFEAFIKKLREEKRVCDFEFLMSSNDNRSRWGLISGRYFRNENFIEGIVSDITDSHLKSTELIRVNDELDKFIYHASHDLRSPLSSILGLLNLMDKDSASAKTYIEMIRSKVKDLDELLREITSIAFNNKTEVRVEKMDWNELVHTIVSDFKLKSQEVKCVVSINSQSDFYNDIDRIRIILRCLISNAFKYVNRYAGIQSVVHVLVSQTDTRYFEIEVKDNGVGISNEHLDAIFNLFYKANTEFKGNGIGLYVVKAMLDKIGGTIEVHTKVGSGTSFKVKIPNRVISIHSEELQSQRR